MPLATRDLAADGIMGTLGAAGIGITARMTNIERETRAVCAHCARIDQPAGIVIVALPSCAPLNDVPPCAPFKKSVSRRCTSLAALS